MLGIKQEALADQLGGDWSQKKISVLEGKEVIEADLLDQLAKALKVPADALKNFNEETAINVISNTFNDHSANHVNYQCTFNPLDKMVELYEALLKSEREKIAMLERFLETKK
jgi:transcriptional regulator with XRE-family HTH domain